MSYNDLVLSLFFSPNHAELSKPVDAYRVGQFIDISRTQQIDFYVDKSGRGAPYSLRYKVKGNPYIVAGAEWMAQALEKSGDGAILMSMTPQYWLDLFAMPKLDKQMAVSLSQAAKIVYKLIQTSE